MRAALILLLLGGLTACATNPAVPAPAAKSASIYDEQETRALTVCLGMGHTAATIAQQKLSNVPIEEARKSFETIADESMKAFKLATVDKVYADTVTNWWDYSLSFFDECALNVAEVTADRVRPANHCLQDSLLADLAYNLKSNGASKDEAAAHLTRLGVQGPTPAALLDRVYAGNEERPVLMLNVWNACMSVVAAKP